MLREQREVGSKNGAETWGLVSRLCGRRAVPFLPTRANPGAKKGRAEAAKRGGAHLPLFLKRQILAAGIPLRAICCPQSACASGHKK